ncbi:hypothetical protein MF406_15260 [Georgenia sp. TF02-10]|uniref:hypothetical protein n=1 Tax=Georgenia sp. TF02-10 TaxID=2917725 RepID=UPI001FA7C51A|nr:hypothetical protein [Georgenia sp. TF02-10]UNX54266.1 hypothetical protein MF406_15260 [Georgenia sp. TF02-10]
MPASATPPPSSAGTDRRAAAAVRLVRSFGLTLLAALMLSLLALPWPWLLLPGVGFLAALVLGVLAIRRLRAAKIRGALVPVVVVGMVMAALAALTSVSQAVLWREYEAYQRCVGQAITEQARQRCAAELERDLDERLRQTQQTLRRGS